MTLAPGIYGDISAEVYHGADVTDEPSLSASIAKVLLAKSPLHAYHAHPRLNPMFEREVKDDFDLGTAAHDLFFEGGEKVNVIEGFDNWKTKAAQTAREAAREAGFVPVLEKHWIRMQAMVEAIRDQLAAHDADPPLFDAGKPEQTLVWRDKGTGVLCRARLDWLRDDRAAIDDLKTTGASANPHDWGRRTFWSIGADIEARFHARGIKALTGKEPLFRFAVVENQPPYCLSVVDLAPSAVELADEKINVALALWKQCFESGQWPGYPTGVASIETTWQEADWLMRHWEPEEDLAA